MAVILRLAEGKMTELELVSWVRESLDRAQD